MPDKVEAATVTYDNATVASCGTGGGDVACTQPGQEELDFTNTTGSGSNRAMAVGCTTSGSSDSVQPDILTITYAGVSLSQLAKRNANYDTYLWTLPNGVQPTSGTNHVIVTSDSAPSPTTLNCVALTVTGVDQTTTWTVSDCTGAGSGTTASATLSANGSNDLVVVFECNGTSIGNPYFAIMSSNWLKTW